MIINECESTSASLLRHCRTKKFSQQQTWRNHSLNATRKEVVEKLWASEESRSTMERQFPVRGSVPFTRETARYRDEDEENKAKFEAKIRVCIRCEHKRYTMRMPETTSAQEVLQRITASRRAKPYREKHEDKFARKQG